MADRRRERGNSVPRDDEDEKQTKVPKLSGPVTNYEKRLESSNPAASKVLKNIENFFEHTNGLAETIQLIDNKTTIESTGAMFYYHKLRNVISREYRGDSLLLFDAIDSNNDGNVEQIELLQFFKLDKPDADIDDVNGCIDLFCFMDRNGDKIITKEEFNYGLQTKDELKAPIFAQVTALNADIYSKFSLENFEILKDLKSTFAEKQQYNALQQFKLHNEIKQKQKDDEAYPDNAFSFAHYETLNRLVDLNINELQIEMLYAKYLADFINKIMRIKMQTKPIDNFYLEFFTAKYNEMKAQNTSIQFAVKK